MKEFFVLFILIFLFLQLSCKKTEEKDGGGITTYSTKEDLDSIPLVVLTEKSIEILNLKTLKPLRIYRQSTKNLIETVLIGNRIFFICKEYFFWIGAGQDKVEKVSLPFVAKGVSASIDKIIVYDDNSVFKVDSDGKLTKLVKFKRELLEVQSLPDFSSLVMVFHEDEVDRISRYSFLSEKVERSIELKDFVKMQISTFGKRIYVLTKNKVVFLDTKNFRIISEVGFEGEGVDFIKTASENKISVFTKNPEKIVTIKRTILKVVSEIDLSEFPEQKRITGDGQSIFFFSQDTMYKLDTGCGKVVKRAFLEKKLDILASTEKGSKVIAGKRGENYLEIINGNTLVSIKEITLDAKVINIICGKEPYREKLIEPEVVEPVGDDTSISKILSFKSRYFTLQVSSSNLREGAIKLHKSIRELSLPVYIDSSKSEDKQKVYKVKIGAFESKDDAECFMKGIKGTHGLSSWVTEGETGVYSIKESGIDINGDKNREILLFDNDRILLFTNFGGVQKSVLIKNMEGIKFSGKPITMIEGKQTLFGLPFDEDSVLVVRWMDSRYELEKRRIPKE